MIFQKFKQDIYDRGYEAGKLDGLRQANKLDTEQIERKALNLFAEKNHIVNPFHVFDLTRAGVYIGMEPVTRERAKELKSQASLLKGFLLWDVLQETIRNEAVYIGLKTSTNFEGVLQGKAMLLNLDIIRGIVEKMDKINPDLIPEKSGTGEKNLI
jgi:hypothetical protein